MAKKYLSLCLISLLLNGCATGAKFERHSDFDQNRSLIYIYRPSALTGGMRSQDVFANGLHIARLGSGDYTFVELEPGTYDFVSKIKPWPGDLESVKQPLVMNVSVVAGHVYYLVHYKTGFAWSGVETEVFIDFASTRHQVNYGYAVKLQDFFGLIRESYALEELESCSYVEPVSR